MYVDKQSAGRLEVVRRPRLVGGEVEGMGRLKGDLDLVGEELLGELRVGLGERDGLGVEADLLYRDDCFDPALFCSSPGS